MNISVRDDDDQKAKEAPKLMAEGKITVMSTGSQGVSPLIGKKTKGLKLSLNSEQREDINEEVIITPNLMNLNGLTSQRRNMRMSMNQTGNAQVQQQQQMQNMNKMHQQQQHQHQHNQHMMSPSFMGSMGHQMTNQQRQMNSHMNMNMGNSYTPMFNQMMSQNHQMSP